MNNRASSSRKAKGMPFDMANWHVDPASIRISNDRQTIKLQPMAMAVLDYLACRPGTVVSRQELEKTVWSGKIVGYDALSNAIIKLRKALGDEVRKPHIIETIPKTGYRLIADVRFGNHAEQFSEPTDTPERSQRWSAGRIAAVVFVLVIGITFWWQPWVATIELASSEKMAFPLPDKPSIAVLPFINIGDDTQQEYFADGMTEDLITDISKVSGLFVIARNSVFTYKGKTVKIRQVAEELGVRYVMEGSVRRAGNQVRVNAQLIDATTGGHVWAERYDGSLEDVFSIQDKITQSIVSSLSVALVGQEQGNLALIETDNPGAYDAFLLGWQRYHQGTPEDLTKAVYHFEQAIQLDPDYARAYSALAAVFWNITWNGWWRHLGLSYSQALTRSRLSLDKSMEHPSVLTHQVASERAAYMRGKPDKALAEARRAIKLDANNPAGYLAMSIALLKANRPAEAMVSVRTAMRIDPHYPASYLTRLGQIQFAMGQYEIAAITLEEAAKRNPDDDWTFVYLAATYGHLGREQETRHVVEQANELRTKAGWGALTILSTNDHYFKWVGNVAPLKEGLRKAGVEVGGNWLKLISSGASGNEVQGAKTIGADSARMLHERGVPFIDVSHYEFMDRVPGAYHLQLWTGEFNEVQLAEIVGKRQEVVIYARAVTVDRDALRAAARAVTWGFEKVYFFRDGLDGWDAAGYPVEAGK